MFDIGSCDGQPVKSGDINFEDSAVSDSAYTLEIEVKDDAAEPLTDVVTCNNCRRWRCQRSSKGARHVLRS